MSSAARQQHQPQHQQPQQQQQSGACLAPPPPPPAPPMPPPLPSSAPVVVSVLPRSVSPKQTSFAQSKEAQKQQADGTNSLTALIRPTTAGLLQYPSLPESREQQASARTLSPEFKQELLEKQLKLSPSSNPTDASMSIEDKIKQHKRANYPSGIRSVDYGTSMATNRRPQYNNNNNNNEIPEKLMSAMQQETKPFAYTVNVSDPNNRGKLDLSQIKSPIMRRRLIANMESVEREDEEDDDDDQLAEDRERSNIYSPESSPPPPPLSDTILVDHGTRANKSISFSPTVSFGYHGEPPPPANRRQQYEKTHQVEHSRPVIQYNEPPKFYNNNNNSSIRIEPNHCSQAANRVYYNQQNERATAIDRLDAEMAKTLDDFERLLSDLNTNEQRAGTTSDQPLRQVRHQTSDTLQPKLSTFVPATRGHASLVESNTPSMCHHNGRPLVNSAPACQPQRTIGDYLLGPDANYFAAGSSNSPYSISPYYGSSLDSDRVDTNRPWQPIKQSSNLTFTPRAAQCQCAAHPQPSFYSNSSNRSRLSDLDGSQSQFRSLMKVTNELEVEFDRLAKRL